MFSTQRLAFALLAIATVTPSLCLIVTKSALQGQDRALLLGLTLAFLLTLPYLCMRWPRTTVGLLTAGALLAVMQCWFIAQFGWVIDANALALVAETNPAEAGDFGASLHPLWLAASLGCIALAVVAWPRSGATVTSDSLPLLRRLALMGLLTLSGLHALSVWLQSAVQPQVPDATFPAPASGLTLMLRAALPSGYVLLVNDFIRDRSALHETVRDQQHFRFGVAPPPYSPNRRIYVLVLGETTRGDRLGLNGHVRDTTPQLSARGDILAFRRMYSASTFTRLSLPVILSRKPPHAINAVFDEASIVAAFREAGFHTAWISLQAPLGYHESPVTLHAHEARDRYFLNPVDYRRSGLHDDAAIPVLDRLISSTSDDLFVVVHTLGSHFRYTDRYPDAYRSFLPDRPRRHSERLYALADKTYLNNAYDNSILFMDAVLAGLIKRLQVERDARAWMFYVSDHGGGSIRRLPWTEWPRSLRPRNPERSRAVLGFGALQTATAAGLRAAAGPSR